MNYSITTIVTSVRRTLLIILVNLVGIVLVFGVAEGVARLMGLEPRRTSRGDRGLWRYEPLRGWGHLAGASGEDFRGGPDRGAVRINAQGFRGLDFARNKGKGARRILLLGDSFGFGVGVDESHTAAARLAELVNADRELTGGSPVQVFNLSVSGYSTDQQVLTFESEGAILDPDVVILLMCDNDFDGNMEGFAYRRYYKPRFLLDSGNVRLVDTPAPRAERRRPVRTWLFDHSAFQSALVGWAERPRLRALARWLSPGEAPRSSGSPEELMLALLQKLNREVSAVGASLVTFNTGHRGERTPLFQSIRPYLEQYGIAHLGLEAQLGDARRRRPELKWDFGEDTHWNVASHDLAARVMHLHLRRLAREGRIRLGA